MGYEIDWHAVGEESMSGDAITIHWGDLYSDNRSQRCVVVIDGGFKDTGETIADHISEHYDTNHVDLVVSTHPDDDHINGLLALLDREDMTFGRLWLHQPWSHNAKAMLTKYAVQKREKADEGSFDRYVANARDLHEKAVALGMTIEEPFRGTTFATAGGALRVMGPSSQYYAELVPDFGQKGASGAGLLAKAATFFQTVRESLFDETLTDSGETRVANNSSVITLFAFDDKHTLFTGDAGIPALTNAAAAMDAYAAGVTLDNVQVPHHGSRRNVGPTVLDRLLGSATASERGKGWCSSAAKNPDRKHPAKMVTNAFHRRGYPVRITAGQSIRNHHDAPSRPSWSGTVTPEPFHDEVEDFDD